MTQPPKTLQSEVAKILSELLWDYNNDPTSTNRRTELIIDAAERIDEFYKQRAADPGPNSNQGSNNW